MRFAKHVLLVLLFVTSAHCDRLYFLGTKTSFYMGAGVMGKDEANHYLLLHDDSTYVRAVYWKTILGEKDCPVFLLRGTWSVVSDSLVLKGASCRNVDGTGKCEPASETFGFVRDSIDLPYAKKLDPKVDTVLLKKIGMTEDQLDANCEDHSTRNILVALIGVFTLATVLGVANK